jgi:hypothetical protein
LLEPSFVTDAVWLRRCGPSTTEQEAVATWPFSWHSTKEN